MAVSKDFLEYVIDQLSEWEDVRAKRMFGGAGLFRDSIMFGLVSDNVVYLKVDDSNRNKFLEAGSSPLKPFPEKPTILSYYEIPPDILETPDEFIEWARESLSIQLKQK